jgi:hypothetical protein
MIAAAEAGRIDIIELLLDFGAKSLVGYNPANLEQPFEIWETGPLMVYLKVPIGEKIHTEDTRRRNELVVVNVPNFININTPDEVNTPKSKSQAGQGLRYIYTKEQIVRTIAGPKEIDNRDLNAQKYSREQLISLGFRLNDKGASASEDNLFQTVYNYEHLITTTTPMPPSKSIDSYSLANRIPQYTNSQLITLRTGS